MRHYVRGLERRLLLDANLSDCRRHTHRLINSLWTKTPETRQKRLLGSMPSRISSRPKLFNSYRKANNSTDVFVHDRQTGITERVSVSSVGNEGDSDSTCPVISADGRFVVFESLASNLVAGDTNGFADIFVHDRASVTINDVIAQIDSLPLSTGPKNSLTSKLTAASDAIKRGNLTAACNQLSAFINNGPPKS